MIDSDIVRDPALADRLRYLEDCRCIVRYPIPWKSDAEPPDADDFRALAGWVALRSEDQLYASVKNANRDHGVRDATYRPPDVVLRRQEATLRFVHFVASGLDFVSYQRWMLELSYHKAAVRKASQAGGGSEHALEKARGALAAFYDSNNITHGLLSPVLPKFFAQPGLPPSDEI